jgi:electron transport complex protein RnfG
MNQITVPLITSQAEKEQIVALKKVMPKATQFIKQENKENEVYSCLSNENKLCGYIVKVSPTGYSGKIDMLVGISNKAITGISILKQTETPGLGAKATEKAFQEQFIEKSIEDAFIAKKDVKAITGSTITSQAVSNGIKTAITVYNQLIITKE